MDRTELIARHITAEAALENWQFCFQTGRYSAARSWWAAYQTLTSKEA